MGSANKPRIPGQGAPAAGPDEQTDTGSRSQVEHLKANAFGVRQLNCQKI